MVPVIKKRILFFFLLASTGCDTTSSIKRQSKTSPLKKSKLSKELQSHAETNSDPQAEEYEVAQSEGTEFIVMYGRKVK